MQLDLSHRVAAHCENGAISALLRYHGIDLSEPMIFGLASGLFFTHLPFVKMAGMPVTSFRTFPGVLFKRITKLLGIKTATRRYLNKEHAMRDLDRLLLEQKTPVGCVVGMYYLPYMPMEYRFHFNGHNICIIGKDEQQEQYSVLDSNATQLVTLSRKDLLKVRFAKGGTYPLLGQMYWIKSVPRQLPPLEASHPKVDSSDLPQYDFATQFYPIRGCQWYCLPLAEHPAVGAEDGKASCVAQSGTADTHAGRNRDRRCGLQVYLWSLSSEAATRTDVAELNDFSKRITAIGDQWREFAYKASRIFKKREGEQFTYDDLGDLLESIGKQERDFFTDLDAVVMSYLKSGK